MKNVKIHCWGGLGSQLHALTLHRYLINTYPERVFTFAFHSSGVTRRTPDPEILKLDISYEFIDDFKVKSQPSADTNYYNLYSLLRPKLVDLLAEMYFSIRPISTNEIVIKPWTYEIRSHYSQMRFHRDVYDSVDRLMKLNSEYVSNNTLCIHFRAGDLLNLESKAITPLVDVVKILNSELFMNSHKVFFTESSEWLRNSLRDYPVNGVLEFRGNDIPAISLMRHSISARQFIGTNSKLSLWIVLFRLLHGRKDSALPKALESNFELMRPDGLELRPIFY